MLERKIIEVLMANRQATHNSIVSNSVGMALFLLFDIYFGSIKTAELDAAVDEIYNFCMTEIEKKAAVDAGVACAWLRKVAEQKINQFDRVTLYFETPIESERFKSICFPLKQVIALVWLAVNDHNKYQDHITEKEPGARKEALEKHYQDRLLTFYNCIKGLQEKPVCHQGIRHELVFILNKSYPEIDLLEDAASTIVFFLKQAILSSFVLNYQDADIDRQKILFKAAIDWIKDANPEPLRTLVDSDEAIYKALAALMIKHGSCPKDIQLEEKIQNALPSLSFSCDIKTHRTLYFINLIFQLEAKMEVLTTAKNWIVENLEINEKQHMIAVMQFYGFYHSYQSLITYHYLLSITGRLSDGMVDFKKQLEYYLAQVQATGQLLPKGCQIDYRNMMVNQSAFKKVLADSSRNDLSDLIENFFCHYFAAKRDGSVDKLAAQYTLLLNAHFQRAVILTDSVINRIYEAHEGGFVHIGPYEINRVFLTAILTPITKWSKAFGSEYSSGLLKEGIFPQILAFVKSKFNLIGSNNAGKLEKESYPAILLDQLTYYYSIHCNQLLADADIQSLELSRPKEMLLLPGQVRLAEEWLVISYILREKGQDIWQNEYQRHFVNIDRLVTGKVRKLISDPFIRNIFNKGFEFDNSLVPVSPVLFNNGYNLNGIQIDKLPEKSANLSINILGSCLLSIPDKSRWPFICKLVKENLFQTGYALAWTLSFTKMNKEQILPNWDEFVLAAIQDEAQFIFILKKLHINNRLSFLKNALINGDLFTYTIEKWEEIVTILSPTDVVLFQKYLALNQENKILMQTPNLFKLYLQVIGPDNYSALFQKLVDYSAVQNISWEEALADILTLIPDIFWPSLFKHFGENIHLIIQDVEELANCLCRFSRNKYDVFMQALGDENLSQIIQNIDDLNRFFTAFPMRYNWGDSFSANLKAILTNPYRLEYVLQTASENIQLYVLRCLAPDLRKIIQSSQELISILKSTASIHHFAIIEALTENMKSTLQDREQLETVLALLLWPTQLLLIRILAKDIKNLFNEESLWQAFRAKYFVVILIVLLSDLIENMKTRSMDKEKINNLETKLSWLLGRPSLSMAQKNLLILQITNIYYSRFSSESQFFRLDLEPLHLFLEDLNPYQYILTDLGNCVLKLV